MLRDNLLFLKEFIHEFDQTGSFFPTSLHAATALTEPIRESDRPLKVLELGPGTGSVTMKILEDMGKDDELTVCEINPTFMATLKRNLSQNEHFRRHHERVKFFTCAAQALPEDTRFDVIVCALPFLNFDPAVVQDIFAKLERLSSSHAVLTYYEYIGLRKIGLAFASPERKRRLRALESFYSRLSSVWHLSEKKIWRNVTPISVIRVEICPGRHFQDAAA